MVCAHVHAVCVSMKSTREGIIESTSLIQTPLGQTCVLNGEVSLIQGLLSTVELPNNGQIGSRLFVLYMEVVPFRKLKKI